MWLGANTLVETVEKKPLRLVLSNGLYLPHLIERLLNLNFGYRCNSYRMRSINPARDEYGWILLAVSFYAFGSSLNKTFKNISFMAFSGF